MRHATIYRASWQDNWQGVVCSWHRNRTDADAMKAVAEAAENEEGGGGFQVDEFKVELSAEGVVEMLNNHAAFAND